MDILEQFFHCLFRFHRSYTWYKDGKAVKRGCLTCIDQSSRSPRWLGDTYESGSTLTKRLAVAFVALLLWALMIFSIKTYYGKSKEEATIHFFEKVEPVPRAPAQQS